MKKILLLLIVFSYNVSFALDEDPIVSDVCKYTKKFNQCLEANENGDTRSIEDFLCLSSDNYLEIMGQIILDVEFKKIDKKVNEYLEWLEDNKNYYFGVKSEESFLSGIDEIETKFDIYGEYGEEYMNLCKAEEEDSIVQKTLECFNNVESIEGEKYFLQNSTCNRMVILKLEIAKQVAYDILKLNKHQIKKDYDKEYMQKERSKYDELLEIVMINIGYLERIRKKWPSKTKSAEE